MRPGRASATAMLVAASVALRGSAHGLPAAAVELAERAIASTPADRSLVALLARHRFGRCMLAMAERVVLPGLAVHHCARKAWLWQRLERLAPGRQLVWLGVGFDGLGRALLQHACVIETDHPDTLRQRVALVGEGAVRMRALQLPAQLDELANLCSARPTTIVCEGMLMYLPKRVAWRALRRLAALPEPPELIFSALDTLDPAGRGFRAPKPWVRRWLEWRGEPFRWRCRPERVRRCLAGFGYGVEDFWDGGGFGEYMVVARVPTGHLLA
jgi:O-methyltransferase involved in polyketide biosynthesis